MKMQAVLVQVNASACGIWPKLGQKWAIGVPSRDVMNTDVVDSLGRVSALTFGTRAKVQFSAVRGGNYTRMCLIFVVNPQAGLIKVNASACGI